MTERILKEILGEFKDIKQDVAGLRQDIAGLRYEIDGVKDNLQRLVSRVEQNLGAAAAELNNMNTTLEQSCAGIVTMLDITHNHVIETQKNLSLALYYQETHNEQLEMHNESINILATKTLQHEAEIKSCRKKQVF